MKSVAATSPPESNSVATVPGNSGAFPGVLTAGPASGSAAAERSLRIVLVLLEPPVPFGNAGARWFYVLLKGLVARGHRVTTFAVCSKPAEIETAQRLFPAPQYDLRLYEPVTQRSLWGKWQTLRQPYSYLFSPRLRNDLKAELDRGYDVLHLEQIWSGWIGRTARQRAVLNIHYLPSIDLAEVRPQTLRDWLRRVMTFRAERQLLQSYPTITTLSDRLQSAVQALSPTSRVTTIPLGLDDSLYPFIPDAERTRSPVVSVIGSMQWQPTRSAAVRLLTRLWPRIKEAVPEASLQIVGWGARSSLAEYCAWPGVTIVENVPDIQPYFARTGVLLYAPDRGSGMKVKIMEAMAFGIPVVTTSEGVEGLPAVDGVQAGVCDDDAGLIARTVTLLKETDRQNRQRRAARDMLVGHCGPEPTVSAVERLYREQLVPGGGLSGDRG